MGDKTELRRLVTEFSSEMRSKLAAKADAGWCGWNAMNLPDSVLEEKLFAHAARAMRDPKQWVDVANFAAFLWRRGSPTGPADD